MDSLPLMETTRTTTTTTIISKDPFLKQQQQRALRVAFVTGNEMKAREVEAIILEHCYSGTASFDVDDDELEVVSKTEEDDEDSDDCRLLALDLYVLDVNLPEIQEVDTLAIAKNKAMLGSQLVNGPCLVEDTSLCFHALGGMPGPYIKWFQQTLRSEGAYQFSTIRMQWSFFLGGPAGISEQFMAGMAVLFCFVFECFPPFVQVCIIYWPRIPTNRRRRYVPWRSVHRRMPIRYYLRENVWDGSCLRSRDADLVGIAYSYRNDPMSPFRKWNWPKRMPCRIVGMPCDNLPIGSDATKMPCWHVKNAKDPFWDIKD
jgi:inosine/xanthosine triphosphate pyrophosphatase family protein